jgi:hypothetical protein
MGSDKTTVRMMLTWHNMPHQGVLARLRAILPMRASQPNLTSLRCLTTISCLDI